MIFATLVRTARAVTPSDTGLSGLSALSSKRFSTRLLHLDDAMPAWPAQDTALLSRGAAALRDRHTQAPNLVRCHRRRLGLFLVSFKTK